ncbi:hypothetical protein PUN28_010051 [Cardiocondyla obscurior]|uniref:Uncharacterized protein n=1 Tax=Cardiocondyla obscurior TaxID=286306 RepID=A0AAW2FQA9_9HYME
MCQNKITYGMKRNYFPSLYEINFSLTSSPGFIPNCTFGDPCKTHRGQMSKNARKGTGVCERNNFINFCELLCDTKPHVLGEYVNRLSKYRANLHLVRFFFFFFIADRTLRDTI